MRRKRPRISAGAVEERLCEDLSDDAGATLGMTAAADPVLADLWDNPRDAAYDRQ